MNRKAPLKTANAEDSHIRAAACPSHALLEVIADKWTLLLLPVLWDGPKRNAELLRRIQGISQKMLTQTLRKMEVNGFVVRRDFHEVPPRVEYELTELGRSLASVLQQLDDWVETHYQQMLAARQSHGE